MGVTLLVDGVRFGDLGLRRAVGLVEEAIRGRRFTARL